MKSIRDIKEEFQTAVDLETKEKLAQSYQTDSRKGVQDLIARVYREKEKLQSELERLEGMKQFEKKYADYTAICGIDEAGRGPLAGPVVAGAVILPKDCSILYLNDSKQVSASRRDELFDEIQEKAIAIFFRQPTKRCIRRWKG